MDDELYIQIYKEGIPLATVIVDSNLNEVARKGEKKELLDKLKVADLRK